MIKDYSIKVRMISAIFIASGLISTVASIGFFGAQNLHEVAHAAISSQDMAAMSSKLTSSLNQLILMIVGAWVLSLMVIVPLTIWNMNSICKPIAVAERVARSISKGDLTNEIRAEGKDETTGLLRALDEMQSYLRDIVLRVHSSTESINTASMQIAAGNQDLSSRTEQAASNLEQTAASMEELTGTVRNSADASRQANQLAVSATEVARRGGEVVSQVVSTMDEINQSSKKIADIIGVIDGIAFQTNILALNAAVEAARAGEQGRGFAVVAGEVRNLAQRSAEAAKEIKVLIGNSVDKVDVGSRLVTDAGQTMQEIVGSVQRVQDIINEISSATAEQSEGIGQVNTAVGHLDQMTQQNAALVEQSAAAAESLKDQAQRLERLVQAFRVGHDRNLDTESSSMDAHDQRQDASVRFSSRATPSTPPAPVKRASAASARPSVTRAMAPKASARSAASAGAPVAATTPNKNTEGDWESF